MQIVLDRGESRLAMRFFDGYLSRHGQREDFPPDGFELLLFGVNGPMWEGRLPYLVEPLGSYPDEDAGAAPRRRLDPYTRRQWQNRLDLLLDESETRERMRIGGLAGIDDEGVFREVLLLAYDDKSLLQMAAEAEHMVVRVDETAGLVQLVLRDGVLRRSVGPTPISAAGYRILLPGVSPERARDIMMGMVAER